MAGANRKQLDRESLLHNALPRWRFWMPSSAGSVATYIMAAESLDPAGAGALRVVGGSVTTNKWMIECHGPSVTVVDAAGANLSASFLLEGLSIFGEPLRHTMSNLGDATGTGTIHQCPVAFSYLQKITTVAISSGAAGDTVGLGFTQPGSGNQARFALPFRMKNANTLRQIYDRNSGTAVTFAVQLATGTFTMDLAPAAVGTHRLTAVFDPRAQEL